MPAKPLTLKIKVKPGAKTESLVAAEDGTWVASVKAHPVDGKANTALLALVARHFAVARSAVQLKSGAGSRLKLIRVQGTQDGGAKTVSPAAVDPATRGEGVLGDYQYQLWYIFHTMHSFEFDAAKSESNRTKHGMDFVEAQRLWNDPMLLEIPAKTDDELRYLVIGVIDGKHWSAVITYRGANIRLISVRRARTEEVALYES